jgi:uridine kinase
LVIFPKIIGICGGSGSGKSTIVNMLGSYFTKFELQLVGFDNYYRDLSEMSVSERDEINFDHPEALDIELLVSQLTELKKGNSVECPTYDFSDHVRTDEIISLNPSKYIIVDGILALHDERMRRLFDLSIFVDVPEFLRMNRRIKRDVVTRGRSEESVTLQFQKTVLPMHQRYVEPQKELADTVVHWIEMDLEIVKGLADNIKIL